MDLSLIHKICKQLLIAQLDYDLRSNDVLTRSKSAFGSSLVGLEIDEIQGRTRSKWKAFLRYDCGLTELSQVKSWKNFGRSDCCKNNRII